jgi:lipopolysaccharide transport protein LptA
MDSSTLRLWRTAGALATALASLSAIAADPLPISLDAESSTFNRQTNRVEFRRLSITQGDMNIRADEAVATGLDFEQAEWRFSGGVLFTAEGAHIEADTATITFAANDLQSAELVGTPALFEQAREPGEDPLSGGANRLAYDNVGRVMRMLDGAWFRQGPNEFRGCDLIYDLDQEQITSGSSDCGEPIQITIVPRNGEDANESSSPP